MKKTLLLIPVMLLALSVVAQESQVQKQEKTKRQKFYVSIGLGGGVSTASSFDMLYKYKGNTTSGTVSVVPVGLGNGFNGSVSFGYWFNKYVGAEIAISEFMGLSTKGDSVINLVGAGHATVKVKGGMLSIIPAVVISAGLEKVNPYARFGLQVGVLPTMLTKYNEENASTNPPMTRELYNSYYGGIALGYTAAGGVNFNFTKLLTFWVELQFAHSTWSPSYSQVIKYNVNGEDKLSTLTTWQKETNFVWEKNTNGVVDESQPRQELRKTYPFSTASFNLGIKFRF